MTLKKRLDAVEIALKIKMTPEEARHKKELQKRIDEARKRCGMKRREQGADVDHGASLFDRLKAARLRAYEQNESNEKSNG